MCINVQLLNTGELMLSSRMLAVYQLMTSTDNSPIKAVKLRKFSCFCFEFVVYILGIGLLTQSLFLLHLPPLWGKKKVLDCPQQRIDLINRSYAQR